MKNKVFWNVEACGGSTLINFHLHPSPFTTKKHHRKRWNFSKWMNSSLILDVHDIFLMWNHYFYYNFLVYVCVCVCLYQQQYTGGICECTVQHRTEQHKTEPKWMIHIHQADNKNIIFIHVYTDLLPTLQMWWWVKECDSIGIRKKRREERNSRTQESRAAEKGERPTGRKIETWNEVKCSEMKRKYFSIFKFCPLLSL